MVNMPPPFSTPWMTDGSIAFIDSLLRESDKVIEFGGGKSSLWWASKVAWLLTVEASPKWAAQIINDMSDYPDLIQKWALKFVACEWSDVHQKPKEYWLMNASTLSSSNAASMEDFYLRIDFDPDVIVIDGSARVRNISVVNNYLMNNHSGARIIVVDNMEWLHRYCDGVFEGFSRYDFHEYDINKIPRHQNGKWCTSVWVKND